MNRRYLTLALMLFAFNASLGSTPLCRFLLSAIDKAESKEVIDEVLLRLDDWLTKKQVKHPDDDYYAPYVILRQKRHTLHSPFPGKPVSEDDARVLLTLPQEGERTVWGALSPREKKQLVQDLAAVFTWGKYDSDMTGVGDVFRPPDVDYALFAKELEGHAALDIGLSPTEILRGALCGRKTGVCRQSNAAFAGLLAELGIPNGDIRFVVGSREPAGRRGHIWVEYRISSSHQWNEIDPTPGQGNSQTLSERLLGIRPVSLRKIYPYRQKVLSDFLIPRGKW